MNINRRKFLFGSAAAATFAGCATNKVGLRPLVAGEKRKVALIGFGMQNRHALMPQFFQQAGVEIVTVCDITAVRVNQVLEMIKEKGRPRPLLRSLHGRRSFSGRSK